MQIRKIMTMDLIALRVGDTLQVAEDIIALQRIRHLPVVDDDRLVGLVTHRDLLRASISSIADIEREERDFFLAAIPVREIMTKNIVTVHPDTNIKEAARMMWERKIGCLLVVEDGVLAGIVTEADFLKVIIGENMA